jgi:hypothetical protein
LLALPWLAAPGPSSPPEARSDAEDAPARLADLLDGDRGDGIDDVYLALTIRSRFSPYESVQYEVKRRDETLIATLTKQLAGGYGELPGLSLLPVSELDPLLESLEACGVDRLGRQLPETDVGEPSPAGADHYELEVRLNAYQRHEARQLGDGAIDAPFWCVAAALVDVYDRFGEPVHFRNDFFDPGEFGVLVAISVPAARLFVDERDLGLTTPIYGLRLLPGVHDVRFVNDRQGIDRTYDVTIVEGVTTRLAVELR